MNSPQHKTAPAFDANDFLAAIKATLQQLKTLLKKDEIRRPWYLLLGATQVGKSSLIQQAELTIKQTLTQENQYCQTWILENAVYFELPAYVIEQADPMLWKKVLRIFTSYQHRSPLAGVIVVLDLLLYCRQTRLERTHNNKQLQISLHALTTQSKRPLPVYLVFNRFDGLRGFSEYFMELTAAERRQSFGFLLPTIKTTPTEQLAHFKQSFEQLCQQLNQRLIRHLHQQRQSFKRSLIHDFPLQFESLTHIIREMLKQLLPSSKIAGIFFTSNQTQGQTHDRLAHTLKQAVAINSTPHMPQRNSNKAYFTHQLLTELLVKHAHSPQRQPLAGWRYNTCIISLIAITMFSTFWLAKRFNHDLQQLRHISTALNEAHYWLNKKMENDDALPDNMVALLSTLSSTQSQPLLRYLPQRLNPFPQWKKLQRLSQTRYQELLNRFVRPTMIETVTGVLKRGERVSSDELYNALKVYLMLSSAKLAQEPFVLHWFEHFLQRYSPLDAQQQAELLKSLNTLLQQPNFALRVDQTLVSDTRAILLRQPKAMLAYALLKAKPDYQQQQALPTDSVFSHPSANAGIPILYTQAAFADIYQQQIRHLSQSLNQHDWVLGAALTPGEDVATLEQQVQALYIADYVNWWNLYLYNTHVVAFRNAKQAQLAFSDLVQTQSSLMKLLTTIKNNTQKIKETSIASQVFNEQIANRFPAIRRITADSIKPVLGALHALKQQTATLAKQNNLEQAAFAIAKQRFSQVKAKNDPITQLRQHAKNTPKPVSHWLNQLAENYWHFILFQSQRNINQQWQEQVLYEYQTHLAQRYPLLRDATTSVSVEQFSHFFAPQGTLDQFFMNYLQPFIDTKNAKWQVKRIDGLSLSLNDDLLQQLIRGRLIRKMFFNKNNKNLSVKFALQPISFEPIVKDIVLSINGQRAFTYQGSTKINRFTWPGTSNDKNVTLTIDLINKQHHTITEQGPWAWFKLLDKANLKMLSDTRDFQLLFALNGSAAKFKLIADQAINPFIPNVINRFQLPLTI